ncbi:hypothetical protein DYD21_11815 [Rhodohalobacter sp. SW132]|nr:hypothetical protein DYD21_11815 [Rhodohalobacter sp. SW132]
MKQKSGSKVSTKSNKWYEFFQFPVTLVKNIFTIQKFQSTVSDYQIYRNHKATSGWYSSVT